MNSQIVENQEDFAPGIFDEKPHELDQTIGIKCPVGDHPAALSAIGNTLVVHKGEIHRAPVSCIGDLPG